MYIGMPGRRSKSSDLRWISSVSPRRAMRRNALLFARTRFFDIGSRAALTHRFLARLRALAQRDHYISRSICREHSGHGLGVVDSAAADAQARPHGARR